MSQSVIASEQEVDFVLLVAESIEKNTLDRLILSQYKGADAGLGKVTCRLVELQHTIKISMIYQYKTQDITKNYALDEALSVIQNLLPDMKQANLWSSEYDTQFKRNKKKDVLLQQHKVKSTVAPKTQLAQQHNREKQRYIDQKQPYLHDLGITDQHGQLVPSMARKWKQINKFIEIFSQAVQPIMTADQPLHIVDFGSGKGYLTFAMYDYLKQSLQPNITGVELRENLVEFCQTVANKNQFNHLEFFTGDVRSYHPEQLDVMIALHACDIATDFAIHCGIRLNASVIMCAPCCHKELRPQLTSPQVLKPMLQFGIHQAQHAEMLTDTIRALLLNAYGYETKVFEFVALEHTSKNKMILAVKKQTISEPNQNILAQIEALKAMYGIQTHTLENLLKDEWMDQAQIGCRC
ncbi:SAM-dependent methyltransferase [Acinetobacter apis]|uniref:Methyltransferase domain-containing protein n=1 Tax=Acinetobacter apis TaxID=1229165 RepID=A0A217EFT0_9GAMM|nr:SAM-dependent methyltransferase [Acinetobacter apis]SNQ29207.1 Methyltransferase domain-containing protein [Acinetobacter apis]